jgi:DNA-binding NarL/FixJ family response regulator
MTRPISVEDRDRRETPAAVFVPTISVVDDDEDFLSLVRDLAESGRFHVLDCFLDPSRALREIPKRRPDLVLMDIHIPRISGIECTRALTIAVPELSILVITGYPDPASFLRSLMAGAKGFVIKPVTPEELFRAIDGTLREGFSFGKAVIPYVIQLMRQLRSFANNDGLTEREEEILACILLGLQQKEIAARLKIGEATVHTHVQRLHQKLGVHSKQQIIEKYLKPF